MLIQDVKTGIIAYKSIFFRVVRLGDVWVFVDIVVVLIPFFDFIIRKELLPTFDTFCGEFRQRVPSVQSIR